MGKTVLITPFTAKMSPLFSDASKNMVHVGKFESTASSIKFNHFPGVTSERAHCLFMWK